MQNNVNFEIFIGVYWAIPVICGVTLRLWISDVSNDISIYSKQWFRS